MYDYAPHNNSMYRNHPSVRNGSAGRIGQIKARLERFPLAYRLAQGAFWSLMGGVISRIFAVVSSIIIARILGKDGYGEMGMVQSTIAMLGVFGSCGLGTTVTKHIAQYRHTDLAKVSRIVSMTNTLSVIGSGIMMIVCVSMAPLLAMGNLNRPHLAPLLIEASLLMGLSILSDVQSSALAGFEAYRQIARINIIQGVAAPFITVPAVLWYGIHGAIAALTISAALGLLISSVAMKRECTRHAIVCRYESSIWHEWPLLWKFSLPTLLSALMVAPTTWLANTILVNQPSGYSELGLFNAANQCRMIVMVIPGLLTTAVLPVLAETHGRIDQTEFRRTVALNLRLSWVIALPLTVIAAVLGEPLATLFGRQFSGASGIITTLMITTFFNAVNGTVGSALTGAGRIWTGVAMNLGWATALLLGTVVLVPRYGGLGLALSYLIAYALHTIWVLAYVENSLAPTTLTQQWRLLLFCLAVLAMLGVNAIINQLLLTGLLILASALPAFYMLKTAWTSTSFEHAGESLP